MCVILIFLQGNLQKLHNTQMLDFIVVSTILCLLLITSFGIFGVLFLVMLSEIFIVLFVEFCSKKYIEISLQ